MKKFLVIMVITLAFAACNNDADSTTTTDSSTNTTTNTGTSTLDSLKGFDTLGRDTSNMNRDSIK